MLTPPPLSSSSTIGKETVSSTAANCFGQEQSESEDENMLQPNEAIFLEHGEPTQAQAADLSDADLTDFENLLAAGDLSIYAWVTGNEPVPDAYDTAVFHLIKNFKYNK